MTILRYQYPKWPGAWDGTETVTNFGTFDFDLQDVLDAVRKEQERVRQSPLAFGSFPHKVQCAILDKLAERLSRQDLVQHEIVIWNHKTREWPIERLEREKEDWTKEHFRLSRERDDGRLSTKKIQEQYRMPDYYEDSIFGDLLEHLIHEQLYKRVFCQHCANSYTPQQCSTRTWEKHDCIGWDRSGETLVCSEKHTLYSWTTQIIQSLSIRN